VCFEVTCEILAAAANRRLQRLAISERPVNQWKWLEKLVGERILRCGKISAAKR